MSQSSTSRLSKSSAQHPSGGRFAISLRFHSSRSANLALSETSRYARRMNLSRCVNLRGEPPLRVLVV